MAAMSDDAGRSNRIFFLERVMNDDLVEVDNLSPGDFFLLGLGLGAFVTAVILKFYGA